MSRQIKVTNISPVVVGKQVVITLDIGWKYLALHLKRGFNAVDATNFMAVINGKPFQILPDLVAIEDVNTYYNRPQTAGITTIFFKRPELADSEDRDTTGIGTDGVSTFEVKFDLAAGALSTALEVEADVDSNEPLGFITHFDTADIAILAVGKNRINKFPTGNGNVFAHHIGKPTQDITDVEMIRVVNGVKDNVVETTKEFLEVAQAQADMRPRVPVTAKYTVIDHTLSGVPEDSLQTESIQVNGANVPVERIEANITAATVEPLTIITESVGAFNA